MPTFGTAYDLESLMHYGPYDFAKTDHEVMIPKYSGKSYRMGQRLGLSVRDAAKLRTAYRCQIEQEDGMDQPVSPLPTFSGEAMSPEQCAVQFSDNCRPKIGSRDNCSFILSLEVRCRGNASAEEIHVVATAMAAPPLRAIRVALVEDQIEALALAPVAEQVVVLLMMYCSARDPTSKLPGLAFTNLLEFVLDSCSNVVIKRSDFQISLKLRSIIFSNVTIVYLEDGTFNNLPDLQIVAWHKDLPHTFGKSNHEGRRFVLNSYQEYDSGLEMQGFLKRLHCDCQFAWLRKWLAQNTALKRSVKPGEVYMLAGYMGSFGLQATDVFLPVDCAAEPFPWNLDMIDPTQTAFSRNEPRCQKKPANVTYNNYKLLRTFSSDPIDVEQCFLQFSRTCAPDASRFPSADDLIEYCLMSYVANITALQINCAGLSTTLREVQDIAFSFAKPPLRAVELLLTDGGHVVYHAFSPIRAQVLVLSLFDCVESRTTDKISSLGFGNLRRLTLTGCRDLVIEAEDFITVPHIQMLLLSNSTVTGMTEMTFSQLLHLEVLSVEFEMNRMRDKLLLDKQFVDYVHNLHCSCQFASFRKWLQQRFIDKMKLWHADEIFFKTWTAQSVCRNRVISDNGAVIMLQDNEGFFREDYHKWICLAKEDLYLPVDCGIAEFTNAWLSADYSITNFSVNETTCKKSIVTECPGLNCLFTPRPLTSKSDRKFYGAYTKDWMININQQVTRERRSEFTTLDDTATFHHYDDQALNNNSALQDAGRLPDNGIWPQNGKNIPYSIDANFDAVDQAEILDALHAIESRTLQCLTFIRRTNEDDWIAFLKTNKKRCQSHVGKQGGQQNITLSYACVTRGTIQHLVLHALGLFHEHHRPDRDDYVDIYYNHTDLLPTDIMLRRFPNMSTYGTDYDLESIMHYGVYDLADPRHPNRPVFVPKNLPKGKRVKLGQRRSLSAKDIVKLWTAYNCTIQKDRPLGVEPVPDFQRTRLSLAHCQTLTKLKCCNISALSCSQSKTIRLLCDFDTTSRDWKDVSTTIATFPLHAITLHLFDNHELRSGGSATRTFDPIRRQIVLLTFSFCTGVYSAALISLLRFANLVNFTVRFCYEVVIRKMDFIGLDRLEIVIFSFSTIQSLEWDTFSILPALRILSLENNIYTNRSMRIRQNNVSYMGVDQRVAYIRRLHCSCDFAAFRLWRNANKNLLFNVLEGEIHYIDGVMRNDEIAAREIFYPVDCLADPFPTVESAFNYSQTNYSINEPRCGLPSAVERPNQTESTKIPIQRPETAGRNHSNPYQDSEEWPLLFNTSMLSHRLFTTPSPEKDTTAAANQQADSGKWLYSCLGVLAVLVSIPVIYFIWRWSKEHRSSTKNPASTNTDRYSADNGYPMGSPAEADQSMELSVRSRDDKEGSISSASDIVEAAQLLGVAPAADTSSLESASGVDKMANTEN
ncbi:uncharacterized protein LOC129596550 isoform X2 [Paramacrobiotus metropolitanus]|nr:uncharacterized protein LOC129596550 isoform X2 [Paramacrobiotus metropolitanus]